MHADEGKNSQTPRIRKSLQGKNNSDTPRKLQGAWAGSKLLWIPKQFDLAN